MDFSKLGPFATTDINEMEALPLRLKKNEDRRLRGGHVWVFSNEVDTAATPLDRFEPGQAAVILDHTGHKLGTGYVNPHSLICARLVSRDPGHFLGKSLLVHRINVALSLRERLYASPYYRLIFGESDGLPGLIVDRYADVLVAQISTAGMERVKDEIVAALEQVLSPACLVFRNDLSIRALEGLETYVETALGTAPECLTVEENNVRFEAPLLSGQKTGWFYDHRMNRARMQQYVRGKRVLDMFSYIGGWGVQAAVAGAEEVLCVDSSEQALAQLQRNAEQNGVVAAIRCLQDDAFEALRQLRSDKQRFDVIILDPPAFIKRKKDLQSGTIAYQRLNQQAMQLLARDGILISASCSYHLSSDALQRILLSSSRHLDRMLQILEQGHQAPDHPIHPALPETAYLKAFFCRVLPA